MLFSDMRYYGKNWRTTLDKYIHLFNEDIAWSQKQTFRYKEVWYVTDPAYLETWQAFEFQISEWVQK